MPGNTFFRTEGEKVLYYKADLSVQRFDRLKRNLRNFTIRADEGVNAPNLWAHFLLVCRIGLSQGLS